jgi:hypothetical protein
MSQDSSVGTATSYCLDGRDGVDSYFGDVQYDSIFVQSLQEQSGIIPRLGHDRSFQILSHPFISSLATRRYAAFLTLTVL